MDTLSKCERNPLAPGSKYIVAKCVQHMCTQRTVGLDFTCYV